MVVIRHRYGWCDWLAWLRWFDCSYDGPKYCPQLGLRPHSDGNQVRKDDQMWTCLDAIYNLPYPSHALTVTLLFSFSQSYLNEIFEYEHDGNLSGELCVFTLITVTLFHFQGHKDQQEKVMFSYVKCALTVRFFFLLASNVGVAL